MFFFSRFEWVDEWENEDRRDILMAASEKRRQETYAELEEHLKEGYHQLF